MLKTGFIESITTNGSSDMNLDKNNDKKNMEIIVISDSSDSEQNNLPD